MSQPLETARHCPICNSDFNQPFGPYGDADVPDSRCLNPDCKSLERYRLLFFYLQQQTDYFTRPNTVLDIAPMQGFSRLCQNSPNLRYLSLDISSPQAMVGGDITALPIGSDSVDYVLLYHVLEHIPNLTQALIEVRRVLKPQGQLISQVPLDIALPTTKEASPGVVYTPEMRIAAFGQNDHCRKFGNDYGDILARAGFTVQRIRYIDNFTPEERSLYGLKPERPLIGYTSSEDIFVAVKNPDLPSSIKS